MEDRFIRVDDFSIRYRDTGGNGPVLLCLHGIGGSLEFWDRQLDGLSDRFRVLAIDMPGHGLSDLGRQPYDLPDFAAFCWHLLDALGIGKVYIAGNSMGGAIALLMAGQDQDRAQKIVLAGAASLGRRSPLPFRLMSLPIVGEILTKPGKAAVDQQIKAIFFDPATAADEIRNIVTRNSVKPGGAKAFLATLRFMTDIGGQRQAMVDRARSTLALLRIPVLFVHGRDDAVVISDHSVEAQKLTPNSQLVLLDRCGHTPQLERPSQFNTATAEFLSN